MQADTPSLRSRIIAAEHDLKTHRDHIAAHHLRARARREEAAETEHPGTRAELIRASVVEVAKADRAAVAASLASARIRELQAQLETAGVLA